MIQFFVPFRLRNLSNMRGHWTVRHRYSRQLRGLTATLGREACRGLEIDPCTPKHIRFIAYVTRRFDDDGLQAALKPCRDGLQLPRAAEMGGGVGCFGRRTIRAAQVGCGIIQSDGIKSGHEFEYRQEIARDRGHGGVFVTIEWTKSERAEG